MIRFFFHNFILISILINFNNCFEVPDATVEVFRPRGFRVSIPDVEGIKLFAFHGKLNEELNGREGGTFSRDIIKAKDGRWTFYDPVTEIKAGDTLYYWTYVDYFDGIRKLGYPKDDQVAQITEELIKDKPGVVTKAPNRITTSKPIRTTKPVLDERTCEKSLTTYNGGTKACSHELIFSAYFNQNIDKKWTVEKRFAGDPDYEFVMYTDNPEVLKIENAQLKIKPKLSQDIFGENFVTSQDEYNFGPSCTAKYDTPECVQKAEAFLIKPPIVSAQISTKDSFSFLYGKVEIKAKLPKGDWIYPELYLNPKNGEYGDSYQSGQIRIAFLPGNSEFSQVLNGGCILGISNGGRNNYIKSIRKQNTNWSNSFHRFSVEWTDEKITLAVNDDVYGNIFPPEGGFASLETSLNLKGCDRWRNSDSEMAPFDKDMYVTIGVGVGGWNFHDRTDGSKPWTNDDPKNQKIFYKSKSKWYSTWNAQSELSVEHVKVFAI